MRTGYICEEIRPQVNLDTFHLIVVRSCCLMLRSDCINLFSPARQNIGHLLAFVCFADYYKPFSSMYLRFEGLSKLVKLHFHRFLTLRLTRYTTSLPKLSDHSTTCKVIQMVSVTHFCCVQFGFLKRVTSARKN